MSAAEMQNPRVVTRAQLKQFLVEGLLSSTLSDILQHTTKDELHDLYNTGKSVCRIDIQGEPMGTGFHLGNGWIMTNAHVICHGDEETSSACCASFVFPERINAIAAKSRTVIFTDIFSGENDEEIDTCDDEIFDESDEESSIDIRNNKHPRGSDGSAHKLDEKHKDLALIEVPEVADEFLTGLSNPLQRPAGNGERVYLIHYGCKKITEENSGQSVIPQLFSVGKAEYSERNPHGSTYSGHNAYCQPGSSGAPLLIFSTDADQPTGILVAGVHFAGEIIGSNGSALWFTDKNSLKQRKQLEEQVNCTQKSDEEADATPSPSKIFSTDADQPTGILVAGVHFAGDKNGSNGSALWFTDKNSLKLKSGEPYAMPSPSKRQRSIDNYLEQTLHLIGKFQLMRNYEPDKFPACFKQACIELNDRLKELNFRCVIPGQPPSGISQSDFAHIIWKSECNH